MQQISLTLFTIVGIGIGAMFFGYIFGLLEGRGQGYKKRKQEEAVEQKNKVLEVPLPNPNPPALPVENNLLKLGLDENNQHRLELDGQRVNTSALLPEQRKRLIELMVTMRPWIDAAPVQPRAATPAPAKPVAAQMPSLSSRTTPPPIAAPQTPPSAASVSQPVPTPVVPAPAKSSPEEAAPTTMVGQINTILQKNLVGTPLESQGIRLVESPQGGVIVFVGISKYQGVGDVPDLQVQAAIKNAIAEWEKKFTPK